MGHLCRAKGLPVQALLVLGSLSLTIQCDAARAAEATSDLVFMRFVFDLTSGFESVSPSPAPTFCSEFGSGYCENTGIQANFDLGETFGPFQGDIRLSGLAHAYSPPAPLSVYVDGITGFFSFSNTSTSPVYIPVNWNAPYYLDTQGYQSSAAISVSYSEKDVGTSVVLLPPTQLFQDSIGSNYGVKLGDPNGSLIVAILPLATTELSIIDPQTATASVPEPGSLALFGLGVLGTPLGAPPQSRLSGWLSSGTVES